MAHIPGHSNSYGDLSRGNFYDGPEIRMPDFSDAFSGIDEKYLQFAPTYDDYMEKYIGAEYDLQGQEYGLAGEIYQMAEDRAVFETDERDRQRASAADTLSLSLRGMGQQMGSTLASAQDSAYNIFSQGEQVASGGLGARTNLTTRAMSSIEDSTQASLMGQAMSGIQAKSNYEDALANLSGQAFSSAQALEQAGISYDAAGIGYERAGIKRDQQMEQLVKDYEDEMYDYLLMLGENFDIWGTGPSTVPNQPDILDRPEYDPNDDGAGNNQGLGGFNNTGMTYEELLELYGGGNKTIPTGGGGGGTTMPRTGP
mgnify:FL=1